MKTLNKIYMSFLLLFFAASLVSCKPEDPNYLWLLSLMNNDTTVQPAAGPQDFDLQVDTTAGNPDPILNADRTINVFVYVTTPIPLTDAIVKVSDSGRTNIYFTVSPQTSGNFTGTFTIDANTKSVVVDAVYNGKHLNYIVDITNVSDLIVQLKVSGWITPGTPVKDSDGDGIPDNQDQYPDDPGRASIIKFPANSDFYTVAYESHKTEGDSWGLHDDENHQKGDSRGKRNRNHHNVEHNGNRHHQDDHQGDGYLHAADADFNDYVARVSGEIDLNAAGKAVRLRMNVQHVAGGAKNNYDGDEDSKDSDHNKNDHKSDEHGGRCNQDNSQDGYYLKLNLPVPASFTMDRFMNSSAAAVRTEGVSSPVENFEVLPSSYETITSSNTRSQDVFAPGMNSRVEFILDGPVLISELGKFPYDLFISYKKGKREIHFPGYVFDEEGHDLYLSANGFRWALSIDGDWMWPLENVNIHDAYPEFNEWYTSGGTINLNWFLHFIENFIYSR